MSNDTQVAAHMNALEDVRHHVSAASLYFANGEAEQGQKILGDAIRLVMAVEASARQLSVQPGTDLRATLETALARIEDMLADDDGQAFKEARKFLESARQLAEQPGFVMTHIHRADPEAAAKERAARPLTASPTAPTEGK